MGKHTRSIDLKAFESDAAIEVRAVLNNKGELAGFFIKPWMEQL
jgi:hypothetical protein